MSVVLSAENGGSENRFQELYASAREARRRAQETVCRAEAAYMETKAVRELHLQARARVEQVQKLWLSGQREQLRYSALARLQARLATMPVIEQAKGVLMAQCGWTQDQAFDTLRRASQRSNIRIRDLAANIVASVATAPAHPDGADARGPSTVPPYSRRPGAPNQRTIVTTLPGSRNQSARAPADPGTRPGRCRPVAVRTDALAPAAPPSS
jgi:ANTAR domain-containing protein